MFETRVKEEWKVINDYGGKYKISNLGRIKNKDDLIIKTYKATNGYITGCFWYKGKSRKRLIHRLVAEYFIPNPMNLSDVNHKDEDKENNNINNLEWMSHKDNMNYGSVKQKIGRANRGRKASKETLIKLSENSHNSIWINNDTNEKFVNKNKVQVFIDNGYKLGRLKRRCLYV